jgi:hypothetical protein
MTAPQVWVQRTTRPITGEQHELLVHAVLDLLECGGLAVDFTTEDCEGRVTNLGTEGVLGDIAGPLYDAELEVNGGGRIEVRFVFRKSDLHEALSLAVKGTPFLSIQRRFRESPGTEETVWN